MSQTKTLSLILNLSSQINFKWSRTSGLVAVIWYHLMKQRGCFRNLLKKQEGGLEVVYALSGIRYTTLRHEAFKFVDKGASFPETFDVAKDALQEAAKKLHSTCQDESLIEYMNKDDMDKHIAKLTDELKSANRKWTHYSRQKQKKDLISLYTRMRELQPQWEENYFYMARYYGEVLVDARKL
ncbi:hypothetical protein KIW84_050661 [Lathyrus oleraceus]|uniref:Uncharacterized protein n=1 Tax=Pisum sativum TaxID=3888 RepID=A0A9D5AEW8_PEA|nr:hypothetical protein KIW84_050661 [Pisum sativum]